MQTTKNVNIASMSYTIDDDAYQLLSSYIDDIASRIELQSEREELMRDIECRISEILREQGIVLGKVVTLSIINHCISQIGEPSVFGDSRGVDYRNVNNQDSSSKPNRLMRDMEDKKIGGVCSGLAVFCGLDPTIVRVLFFLFLFFYGTGVLLYLIGWIIIPAASTPAQKQHLNEMKNRINS